MPSNAQMRSPVGATFSADSVTAVPPLSGPTDGMMPLRSGGSCASYRVNGTVDGPKCSPSSETLRGAAPRSPLAGAAHRSRLGDSSVPSCSEPSPTRHESWPPAAKPEPRTVRSGGCRRPRDAYAGATSLTAGGSCSALAAGRWRRVHTIIGASPKSQLFRPHLAGARSATWTPRREASTMSAAERLITFGHRAFATVLVGVSAVGLTYILAGARLPPAPRGMPPSSRTAASTASRARSAARRECRHLLASAGEKEGGGRAGRNWRRRRRAGELIPPPQACALRAVS